MSSIAERLAPIVRAHLRSVSQEAAISPTASLRDMGLDSLGAIDLLFAIEQAFNVVFPDRFLNASTFATCQSLEQAVAAVTGAKT